MKLGALVALLNELVLLGVKILALYREAKRKEWIQEGKLIGDALKDAKTDDDRAELARRLFEHRRL
jgi:hypothetical protein